MQALQHLELSVAQRQRLVGLLAVAAILWTQNAWAHEEVGVAGGLISGLLHPVLGLDHLVAMVAVGLWGAILGQPSIWILPVTFPLVMAFGALLGVAGVPMPGVEFAIAGSALALGIAVLTQSRPPLWLAAIIVGFFAIFHGHAHGSEMPGASNSLAYGVGFVIATGLLHLSGIMIGLIVRWPAGLVTVRCCGAAIAAVGLYFIAGSSGLIT
ncbi:MAG: HupE/UreJ family protein [Pseudomonadota bacterium]